MQDIEQQTQRIVQDLQQRSRRTVGPEARQIIDRFQQNGDAPLFSEAIEQEVRILRARLKDPAHGLRPRRRRGGGGVAAPPSLDSDTEDAEVYQIREELRARRRGEMSARTEGMSSNSGFSDTPSSVSASVSRAHGQRTGFYSPVNPRALGANHLSPASDASRETGRHAPGRHRAAADAVTKASKSPLGGGQGLRGKESRPPSRARAELEGHVAYGRTQDEERKAGTGPEASHHGPPRGDHHGHPRRAPSAGTDSESGEESYSEDDFEDDHEEEASAYSNSGAAQPPQRPEESARGGAESYRSAPVSESEPASESAAGAVEPPPVDESSGESSGGSVMWG